MDSIRSKFFWRGDIDKFKYHMVKWERVCVPKDFGGLEILNTRRLNEALLMKWVWRMYLGKEGDLVYEMLQTKYLRSKSFTKCKGKNGSQFWRGVNKVKMKFSGGARFVVNSGKETLFWEHAWLHEKPLKEAFPNLYACCADKDILVYKYWKRGDGI